MNRLRVRVELNRRKVGVPMEELVSVVEETRKFFHLLAEDVQIPAERGEWLASDFDPESLNFTAEYDGPASEEQIRAFGAAFGGATSLRKETIAQFSRIADFIGEDELVGFGLYQSDQESEPSDWRCLSRRDAMRFADEIRLLAKASGSPESEASLPAVMSGSVGGRRLFKDRREREALATDPSRSIREVESSLSKRLSLLEGEIEVQARKMQSLDKTQEAADERFIKLLSAMESFWSQAPRQLTPSGLEPAATVPVTLSEGTQTVAAIPLENIASFEPSSGSRRRWTVGLALAAAVLIVAVLEASDIGELWSRLTRPNSSGPVLGSVSASASASTSPSTAQSGADASNAQGSKIASAPSERDAIPALPVSSNGTVAPAALVPAVAPQISKSRAPLESGAGTPRRNTGAEIAGQVALEIPSDLRSLIKEQVLVNVTVGIDPKGKVTTAEVASTKGEDAVLLTDEALRAAHWFRFRPAREGNKAVASRTVLTFMFEPDPQALTPEALAPNN